jgi:thioredoxin 1
MTSDETHTRESLARLPGPVVVEFGAAWCPICRAFAPQFAALLQEHPEVRHIKVEDGKGKPLGRSFRVTLWPTFVFQRDGIVREQLVRPSREAARAALENLVASEDVRG